MRITISIAACVAVLGLGWLVLWLIHGDDGQEPPKAEVTYPLVRCLTITKTDRRLHVETQGTVTPRTEIDLVAQVAGEVERISPSLANGGFFKKGEMLVQIDRRDYELEVVRARAQVAQAKLRVTREQAEADIAKAEWRALGKGTPTPLTLREPQVLEAKAAQAAADAMLAKSELARDRTTIKAPFDGRVRMKGVDAGQFVGIGSVLARIYAVDYAEVRLPLHDSKLLYLDLPLSFRDTVSQTPGPEVTLVARFAQRRYTWTARIVRTEGEVDPKSRMVHAIARVRDPYGSESHPDRPPLSVGMFVEAKIEGKIFKDVVEVPRTAVRNGREVLVVDSTSRLHRRPIKVLFASGVSAIVTEGLAAGDRVCLSPIAAVFDGMRVEVIDDGNRGAKATGSNGGNGR